VDTNKFNSRHDQTHDATKHYTSGMPKIWPELQPSEVHSAAYPWQWARRITSTIYAYDRISSMFGPGAAWAIGFPGASLWNELGRRLGYTVWASPEEGNGR
jgi:hypothetical protein